MDLSGNNIGVIRDYLNNNNIPTATQIRYNRATFWKNKTIKLILQNKAYIGDTIQNKKSRINYKNRMLRANPEEQWPIVENTHKPIIDKNVVKRVRKCKLCRNMIENNTLLYENIVPLKFNSIFE